MTQETNLINPPTVEASLNEAFSSYPFQATPVDFSTGVMSRLKTLPSNVRPRFRLSWFDWAFSLFTTGMAGMGYILWQTLPPQVVAQLQVTWLIWLQHVSVILPH
jgi:hypothetical protein